MALAAGLAEAEAEPVGRGNGGDEDDEPEGHGEEAAVVDVAADGAEAEDVELGARGVAAIVEFFPEQVSVNEFLAARVNVRVSDGHGAAPEDEDELAATGVDGEMIGEVAERPAEQCEDEKKQ